MKKDSLNYICFNRVSKLRLQSSFFGLKKATRWKHEQNERKVRGKDGKQS